MKKLIIYCVWRNGVRVSRAFNLPVEAEEKRINLNYWYRRDGLAGGCEVRRIKMSPKQAVAWGLAGNLATAY